MAATLRLCAVLLVLGALVALAPVRRAAHKPPAPHGHAMLPLPEEAHHRPQHAS